MIRNFIKCAAAVMAVGSFASVGAKEYLCLYKDGKVVEKKPVSQVDSIGFMIVEDTADFRFQAFDAPRYVVWKEEEDEDGYAPTVSGVNVKWSTSDNTVAVVTTSGAIAPVMPGECEITGVYNEEVRTWTVEVLSGWEGELSEGTSNPLAKGEFVDLGLSSGNLWAVSNVGASSPEEFGKYFAWGETVEKDEYTSDNCALYNKALPDGSTDADSYLTANYDAATANMGAPWKLPIDADYQELLSECKNTLYIYKGVMGRVFVGPNGNSVFFPACGVMNNSDLVTVDTYPFSVYWSGSPVSPFMLKFMANAMFVCGSDGKAVYSNETRSTGASARGILKVK